MSLRVNGDVVQLREALGEAVDDFTFEVDGAAPVLRLSETDQADPAGRFRFLVTGDALFIQRAASADWATATTILTLGAGLVVFNEAGADWDFRVEGDNLATLLVADAGQDALSFGGANVDGAANTFNNLQGRTLITSVGAQVHMPAQTTTFDNVSETVAIGSAAYVGIQTWAGDTATLTITQPAALYIAGIPVASSNVAFTNTALSLWVDAGTSRFDGDVDLNSTGTLRNVGASGNDWTATQLALVNSNAGGTILHNIENTASSGASSAELRLTVHGSSTGDPFVSWRGAGVNYHAGVDNGDNTFKMGDGTIVGTSTRISFNNSGDITLSPAANLSVTSGIVSVDDTTESTSAVTGSIHTDGGLGVAAQIWVDGDVIATAGVRIGADSTDNEIDDASGGAASTTLYIGNASIDVTASDERMKTDIRTPNGLAREHLALLSGALAEYKYVAGQPGWVGNRYVGHVAQSLDKVLPQYVVRPDDDVSMWSVNYGYMTGPLLWGWKDHEARLSTVEEAVDILRAQVVALGATPEV